MSSRGHGPVDPGTELRHTNGDDKHARYGPLGDGEAGVQVTSESPTSCAGVKGIADGPAERTVGHRTYGVLNERSGG